MNVEPRIEAEYRNNKLPYVFRPKEGIKEKTVILMHRTF